MSFYNSDISSDVYGCWAIRSNESEHNSSHLFSELIIQSTTKKMFAVVQFVGGNFVEAVPLSWLRENEMMCLWPPHRFPNRAIRSSEPPQDSWEAIAAKVLYRTGKRTFHQNECSFELAEREQPTSFSLDEMDGRL